MKYGPKALAATKKYNETVHCSIPLIRERTDSLGPASLEHARESGCMLIGLGFSDDTNNRLSLVGDQSGDSQIILDSRTVQASKENGDVTELCRTIAHLLLSRYSIAYYTLLIFCFPGGHIISMMVSPMDLLGHTASFVSRSQAADDPFLSFDCLSINIKRGVTAEHKELLSVSSVQLAANFIWRDGSKHS